MSNFTLQIFEETPLVTYYSVKFEGSDKFETDKFFEKYMDHPEYSEPVNELVSLLIKTMGEEYGALPDFFRFENKALALPPGKSGKKFGALFLSFPLRLFCYRINDGLVILMNGGEKTSEKAQDSPYLSMKFHEANQIVRRLDEAFKDKTLTVEKSWGRSIQYQLLDNEDDEVWYI